MVCVRLGIDFRLGSCLLVGLGWEVVALAGEGAVGEVGHGRETFCFWEAGELELFEEVGGVGEGVYDFWWEVGGGGGGGCC